MVWFCLTLKTVPQYTLKQITQLQVCDGATPPLCFPQYSKCHSQGHNIQFVLLLCHQHCIRQPREFRCAKQRPHVHVIEIHITDKLPLIC